MKMKKVTVRAEAITCFFYHHHDLIVTSVCHNNYYRDCRIVTVTYVYVLRNTFTLRIYAMCCWMAQGKNNLIGWYRW